MTTYDRAVSCVVAGLAARRQVRRHPGVAHYAATREELAGQFARLTDGMSKREVVAVIAAARERAARWGIIGTA